MGTNHRVRPPHKHEATETTRGFCTRLGLSEAIKKLKAYSETYNAKYPIAVEFSVIGVQEIEDLSEELIDMANMELIETMKVRE
jgi:hypothetical protein